MAKFLFTQHLRERLEERGLSVALVFEAAETGARKVVTSKPWQVLCFGDDVGVVIEDDWKIVTAWWLADHEAGGRARRRLAANSGNSGQVAVDNGRNRV